MLQGTEEEGHGGGQWDTGVAKQLYLMALVIFEPTQVATSLVPFCPSL